MNFQELFHELFQELHCSQTELSKKSGVSRPAISRYLSGEREPATDSKQLAELCSGLARVATDNEITGITFSDGTAIHLTENEIHSIFSQALKKKEKIYGVFLSNFDALLSIYAINMKHLASSSSFDVSYLYRVRSGERRPSNLQEFCETISNYIAANFNKPEEKTAFSQLANCHESELATTEAYAQKLLAFLIPSENSDRQDDIAPAQIQSFLQKLDEFDWNESMRTIPFDDFKLPTVPFCLAMARNYYGIEQMKKSELNFFKTTALSKSRESVFLCNDMPLEDMAQDTDFGKKRMLGIAMMLQKGLHLDIVHNTDCPFNEMMLGLTSWIPLYMTGQVSPYYLPNASSDLYHHLHYISGSVALSGECIHGHHEYGKCTLTGNKDEVTYYKKKANDILSYAKPLMEIYRSSRKRQYHSFIKITGTLNGKRYNLLSSLPLYTIPENLLTKMLERSKFKENERQQIVSYVRFRKRIAEDILKKNKIQDEVLQLSEEEFKKHPMLLSLSDLFTEVEIAYTYEEYLEHLEACKKYAKANKNYECKEADHTPFHNLQIQILENNFVIVSKAKAPAIHFVIHHPKMVHALQNFARFV